MVFAAVFHHKNHYEDYKNITKYQQHKNNIKWIINCMNPESYRINVAKGHKCKSQQYLPEHDYVSVFLTKVSISI